MDKTLLLRASEVGPVGVLTVSGTLATGTGAGGLMAIGGGGVLHPLKKPNAAAPKPSNVVVSAF